MGWRQLNCLFTAFVASNVCQRLPILNTRLQAHLLSASAYRLFQGQLIFPTTMPPTSIIQPWQPLLYHSQTTLGASASPTMKTRVSKAKSENKVLIMKQQHGCLLLVGGLVMRPILESNSYPSCTILPNCMITGVSTIPGYTSSFISRKDTLITVSGSKTGGIPKEISIPLKNYWAREMVQHLTALAAPCKGSGLGFQHLCVTSGPEEPTSSSGL